MRTATSLLALLVAACAAPASDPMPYLTANQRACIGQVQSALQLTPGQTASVFVGRDGRFTGAVSEGGFVKYELDPKPYDACMAQAADAVANAGLAEVAPGVFLSADDKALWDKLTEPQRQRALQFIANGGTVAGSLGIDP
jgi:hypothetical protein